MRAFMSDDKAIPAAIIAAGARPVDRYTIQSRAVAERVRIASDLAVQEARALMAQTEPISRGEHTTIGPLAKVSAPYQALAFALASFCDGTPIPCDHCSAPRVTGGDGSCVDCGAYMARHAR